MPPIVSERPYNGINDLVQKNIITQTTFDKIKEQVGATQTLRVYYEIRIANQGYARSSAMNLTRLGVLLVRLGILVTVGCASHPPFPESSLTGGVWEVKIGDSLTPPVVTAKRGDEVRWVNTTSGPVDVLFYVQSQVDLISCQKGFGSTGWGYLFGSLDQDFLVVATVPPNESASLCFAILGTYVYGVRWHPPLTGYPTRITGSVTIE